jgi:Na+-translocating ferredoxin:NAD+ oxidoreductase RnfG subunit
MIRRDYLMLALMPVACVAPAYAVDYLTVVEAQQLLFTNAEAFIAHGVELTTEQQKQIKALSGVAQRNNHQAVWRAENKGELLGWFMVDDVVGKHEYITYATAISPDGHVLGVEIMSYRETHGGAVRDAAWRATFTGKTVTDSFKLDGNIPNISGATLSCRNVMNGVKRLLALHKIVLTQTPRVEQGQQGDQ